MLNIPTYVCILSVMSVRMYVIHYAYNAVKGQKLIMCVFILNQDQVWYICTFVNESMVCCNVLEY